MTLKNLLALGVLMVSPAIATAQQALNNGAGIVSPQINSDNYLTLRLFAPKAQSVTVAGDFPVEFTSSKDSVGVWEFTSSEALPPELYSYAFDVDGVRTLDPANVYTVRDVATLSNILLVDGGKDGLYAVNDVPHGSVTRQWYDSPTLGFKRRLSVYTPPGYEASNENYPVLYLLHGMGGDEEAWLALGRVAQILDNLIAQGKAQPMIVVMTNGNASQQAAPGESPAGLNPPSFQLPKTMDGSFETSFPEIVNFIDNNYRTKADKSSRAIAGLSMGGFHSMHISKQYPDMFDYVGLFSAAVMREGTKSPIYDNFDDKLATQFEKKPALYWIGIGIDDFLYDQNTEFRAMLELMGYPFTYMETPEGHIWKNWRIYLSEFAPLLFQGPTRN